MYNELGLRRLRHIDRRKLFEAPEHFDARLEHGDVRRLHERINEKRRRVAVTRIQSMRRRLFATSVLLRQLQFEADVERWSGVRQRAKRN
jgi:hypothetical protein